MRPRPAGAGCGRCSPRCSGCVSDAGPGSGGGSAAVRALGAPRRGGGAACALWGPGTPPGERGSEPRNLFLWIPLRGGRRRGLPTLQLSGGSPKSPLTPSPLPSPPGDSGSPRTSRESDSGIEVLHLWEMAEDCSIFHLWGLCWFISCLNQCFSFTW